MPNTGMAWYPNTLFIYTVWGQKACGTSMGVAVYGLRCRVAAGACLYAVHRGCCRRVWTHSSEGQGMCPKLATSWTQTASHGGYRAGISIPHRPSRNSGLFLYSYSQNIRVALAHCNTEPQGISDKHVARLHCDLQCQPTSSGAPWLAAPTCHTTHETVAQNHTHPGHARGRQLSSNRRAIWQRSHPPPPRGGCCRLHTD